MLYVTNPIENVPIFSSILSALYIIEGFLLALVILFIVREYIGIFEKDLIFIVITILILLPIIDTFIMILAMSGIIGLDRIGYFAFIFIINLFQILSWSLAIFAFLNIYKSFDSSSRYTPRDKPQFLPRPKPVAGYVGTFYSRPVTGLFIIIVIAIVLGAGVGASYPDLSGFGDSSDNPFFNDIEIVEHSVYQDGNTVLQEMESQDFHIPVDGYVTFIHLIVVWEDEPDQYPLKNQPDMITVELYYGDYFDSATGENPQGDAGVISYEKVFAHSYEYHSNSVDISIILTYAGDQTGPGGWLTVQSDDSNEVLYEFVITYSTD
jgi:hypothetical protein